MNETHRYCIHYSQKTGKTKSYSTTNSGYISVFVSKYNVK